MSDVDEVLEFWFGKEGEPGYGEDREEWFAAEPGFDREICRRFMDIHEDALEGDLDHWQRHPRSALALVIILDQFSRNMFRDTPEMYEADEKAIAVARSAVDNGFDEELPVGLRWFFYMPFHHSEDMGDQNRSVELFRKLGGEYDETLEYAVGHRETIERFGRFPHRNEILGRKSTPEETKFLRAQSLAGEGE